jgi:4'-phosphopantetheinyl transferase
MPRPSELEAGDVHVWTAALTPSAIDLAALERTLSRSERRRADAFRFETDRSRYIFARGVMRDVLSRYLGMHPRVVPLASEPSGKPCVTRSGSHGSPAFNLSHSDYLVVLAISAYRSVGVDVERIRAVDDIESIARYCFSANERADLERSVQGRERAFYTCWTRKEACVKAIGTGLALPLHSFDTAMAPGGRRMIELPADGGLGSRWELVDLPLPVGYAGALVVESGIRRVIRLTWAARRSEDIFEGC